MKANKLIGKSQEPYDPNIDLSLCVFESDKDFLGHKYRSKAPEGTVMNCIGFVRYIATIGSGVKLSSDAQQTVNQVFGIPFGEIMHGDLLFFEGRKPRTKRVGHVAMVSGFGPDRIEIQHSCSRRIIVEKYPNDYYQKRFLSAGQFLPINIGKVKLGFCAFSPNNGTVSINNHKNVKVIIEKLNQQCDLEVVSFHGGDEGDLFCYLSNGTEFYIGENRANLKKITHCALNAGADLILGHRPHIPRILEIYKNKLICCSLGNFVTYCRFSLSGPKGLAPILKVELNENGDFFQKKLSHLDKKVKAGL